MQLEWDDKGPTERVLRGFDWSLRLGVDTVQSSTWTVDEGTVAIDAEVAPNNNQTGVWLTGGADGETCYVKNSIVTTQGQQLFWIGRLCVRNR